MRIKIDKKKDFLKKLPKTPGVYLFYDKKTRLIYVGRAANLRTRVSSYFRNYGSATSVAQRPIERLVDEVVAIDFKKTPTLLDAAVLEANFIKDRMPPYNIKEKDNKSFVYLFFDMKADFPKPVIIRGRDLGKYNPWRRATSPCLGPYQSQHIIKNILLTARRIYPYSTCKPFDGAQGKPCFHRQIGLCPGVCSGEITSFEYKKGIRRLIKYLESKNPRTKPGAVNDIALMPGKNIFGGVGRIEAYDISHFQKGDAYGAMAVFENGKPKNSAYRLFKIKNAKSGSDTDALMEVLTRRLKHAEWDYPRLIVADGGRPQVNAVLSVLKKTNLSIPVIGVSKAGKHAQSASSGDRLVFQAATKKPVRELLTAQKNLIQRARNEAHRFAIKYVRRAQKV